MQWRTIKHREEWSAGKGAGGVSEARGGTWHKVSLQAPLHPALGHQDGRSHLVQAGPVLAHIGCVSS